MKNSGILLFRGANHRFFYHLVRSESYAISFSRQAGYLLELFWKENKKRCHVCLNRVSFSGKVNHETLAALCKISDSHPTNSIFDACENGQFCFTLFPVSRARSLKLMLSALVAVAVNIAMTTKPIKIQRTPKTRPKINLGVLSP